VEDQARWMGSAITATIGLSRAAYARQAQGT